MQRAIEGKRKGEPTISKARGSVSQTNRPDRRAEILRQYRQDNLEDYQKISKGNEAIHKGNSPRSMPARPEGERAGQRSTRRGRCLQHTCEGAQPGRGPEPTDRTR